MIFPGPQFSIVDVVALHIRPPNAQLAQSLPLHAIPYKDTPKSKFPKLGPIATPKCLFHRPPLLPAGHGTAYCH